MKKKILLSIIVVVIVSVVSAQTTSMDFDRLATNCQLVVEKNNLRNQKQQELADITAELDNYKQLWWNTCYAAIEDTGTTKEEIQFLIDNTFSDIDNDQLIADLNKALQGKPVARQTIPQQPITEKSKKDENPKTDLKQDPPAQEDVERNINDEYEVDPQTEHPEPTKLDPTKKSNDPDKTVKDEKKEDKTTLKSDEVMKNYRKKKNNNN